MNLNRRLLLAAAAGKLITVVGPGYAQEAYPGRPIHIIVPFPTGGIVDAIARVIGDKLSSRYRQPVVVENRPGAGGAIGTEFAARSVDDGYTLLLVSPGHAVLPSLLKGMTWNPVRDFRAVAGFGVVPNVIVVHPGMPVRNLAEFIEFARKSATPLTYATAGIGTTNHLCGELLAQQARIKLTHVPYKGQPDALLDLLAGRVAMMPLSAALALPQIKAGKLRPLAVTTARRSSSLPDLPTVSDTAGLANFDVSTWFGLVAPAKVPDTVLRKLSADVDEILAMPDVKIRLEAMGMELAPEKAAEFDAFIAREFSRWGAVIRQTGLEPQ